MAQVSIRTALGTDDKPYLWTLERDGVEMGVGRAGSYSRHAHRHFADFIHSPWGIDIGGTYCDAVFAQPRTPFGPLQCGDFFFIKILSSGPPYTIPDKIDAPDCDSYAVALGGIALLSGRYELAGNYFDAVAQQFRYLRIEGKRGSLVLESSQGWHLEVNR